MGGGGSARNSMRNPCWIVRRTHWSWVNSSQAGANRANRAPTRGTDSLGGGAVSRPSSLFPRPLILSGVSLIVVEGKLTAGLLAGILPKGLLVATRLPLAALLVRLRRVIPK